MRAIPSVSNSNGGLLRREVVTVSTREFDLTAVFQVVEDGWVQARIRELPGVITVAPTREEAEELLVDALREYMMAGDTDEEGPDGGLEVAGLRIAVGF